MLENYRIWAAYNKVDYYPTRSSILFDTVAAYLAFSTDLCVMERMGVRVTDDGFTVEDCAAPLIDVATAWKDYQTYLDFLVDRLAAPVVRPDRF